MSMSKRNYQAIARAIHAVQGEELSCPVGIERIRDGIADVLAADNPRFDRERFIEACETGRWSDSC